MSVLSNRPIRNPTGNARPINTRIPPEKTSPASMPSTMSQFITPPPLSQHALRHRQRRFVDSRPVHRLSRPHFRSLVSRMEQAALPVEVRSYLRATLPAARALFQ